jgi:hypothetical protein
VVGRPRPLIKQVNRKLDWSAEPMGTIVRRIRAAEGNPGVLDSIAGAEFHLFGAHAERSLRGQPGAIIAQRHGAVCRATVDGAVWISHLERCDGRQELLQASGDARAGTRGARGRRPRGPHARPRCRPSRTDLSRHLVRGGRASRARMPGAHPRLEPVSHSRRDIRSASVRARGPDPLGQLRPRQALCRAEDVRIVVELRRRSSG